VIYALFWLVQHLLTVLTAGMLRVPEIFLLSLVYALLTKGRDVSVKIIWTAFAGGLLWDIRWMGIPGFFTLSYVGVVLLVLWTWNTLPAPGRTLFVIFALFWAAQLFPSVLFFLLVLEQGVGDAGGTFFAVQQACAIPLSLLGVFLTNRMRNQIIED
jgi:rod shape-determining protein MreD